MNLVIILRIVCFWRCSVQALGLEKKIGFERRWNVSEIKKIHSACVIVLQLDFPQNVSCCDIY